MNLNVSPVLLHNPLDSVEPEASTFPHSFRREERLKDVGLHLVGNSRTVIANFDYSATVVAIGSDAKLALSVHSVNRVIDELGPDLAELAAKRIHQEGIALVIALHDHALLQLVVPACMWSGLTVSIKRMQCDHKPIIRRLRLDLSCPLTNGTDIFSTPGYIPHGRRTHNQ